MSCLPKSGRITCSNCFKNKTPTFDITIETSENWRIKSNPLAWGNTEPEVVVLGFSKGPTQAGALAKSPHDDIAYKGSRLNVAKIMAHVGLVEQGTDTQLRHRIDNLISDATGKFHFGSLIRCKVEQYDEKTSKWGASGGGMLDKFVATDFGQTVTNNCTSQFLNKLPASTKLVLMFGMGTKQNYVKEAHKLFQKARGGQWKWVNEVAYTDGKITVVHVEHFASQGALIPNWLGINDHPRSRLGALSRLAVKNTL